MGGQARTRPQGADLRRKLAIVALSLGAHALVLGVVGLRAVTGPDGSSRPAERIVYVQIEPRPLMPGEVARVQPLPAPTQAVEARPDAGPAVLRTDPFRRREDEDERALSSPRSPAARSPALPPDVGTAPWRVRPETLGDRVGRGLRTRPVGCASPNLLTPAERAICDDRFGERAAAAAPIEGTGNPRRDARFAREGARALAEYEARRRPLSGGVGIVGPQDGPGSNFGMGVAGAHLDPSLRPDSTSDVRTRRDGQRAAGTPLTPGASSPRD